jgi:hypothetical protein
MNKMWDFRFSKIIALLAKTFPFIIFRLLVYLGIGIAYIFATGIGASIGYGIGRIGSEAGGGAGLGGLIGFAVASGILYWFREYILYLVKAGHIAVMVEYLEGNDLPGGNGQIGYAQAKVRERFAQTSVLFAVDQLIKGILRALNRLVFSISAVLPIPGLEGLAGIANKILNISLTYTDEVILAYNFKTRSTNPWASGKDALILYAQNYKIMLKNAFFLMVIMYLLTFVIFLVMVGPVIGVFALFPGSVGIWGVVLAFVLAWCLKAALLDPFAIAGLMQVYFERIVGQVPNPVWDEKLTSVSDKFRNLKEKALGGNLPPAQA